MKQKKLLLLLGITALLFSSCDIFFSLLDDPGSQSGDPGNQPLGTRDFWAQNATTYSFYSLRAELLHEGKYCTVWAEKGSGVSGSTAHSMANAYDNDIYPKMMNTFGTRFSNGMDTMQAADLIFGDEDGKLCILLLDIRDGYSPQSSSVYVGGYFSYLNNYENVPSDSIRRYSNGCDMIYVDTYPGKPGSTESNSTLAHEMQHLMNFVTGMMLNGRPMDLWINEGLSSAAEWVYAGHPVDKRDHFNRDPSGLIGRGNNFFVWDNYTSNPNAIYDDYSTVYLFFQWLRLQASRSIYQDIITSSNYDYRAVTGAADAAMPGNGYNTWGTLLKTWLLANYVNSADGPYGYMNDSTLKTIRAKTAPAGAKSISLAPGEGVFSVTNSEPALTNQGPNIRNAFVNKNTGMVSDRVMFMGGAMLTYNINSNTSGSAENGIITGVASVEAVPRGVLDQPPVSAPYPISITEMLRRNGFE